MSSKGAFAVAIVCSAIGCILFITALGSTSWITGCTDFTAFSKMLGSSLGGSDTAPSRQTRDLGGLFNGLSNTANSFGDTLQNTFSNMGQSNTPVDSDNPLGDTDLSSLGDTFKNMFSSLGQSNPPGDSDTPLGNTDLTSLGEDSFSNPGQGSPFGDVDLSDLAQNMPPLGGMMSKPVCLNSGLFKLGTSVMGGESSIPKDVSQIPGAVIFSCIGLAAAILCSVAAVIVLITSAAGNTESYEGKGRATTRAGVGIVFLAIAGFAGLCGMIAYTAQGVKTLKNPSIVMTEMFGAVSKMTGMDMTAQSSVLTGPMSGITNQVMSNLIPLHFGYAFYLGWVGVALLIVGIIVAALAKQKLIQQPYSGNDPIKL